MTSVPFRFLALGDSYTIGESTPLCENWPNQLVVALRQTGIEISPPTIIAETGWTTQDLLLALNKANLKHPYNLVTLLIGVNNQYRGWGLAEYRQEIHLLLRQAIAYGGNDPGKVIVISIPDWGKTPFANDRNRRQIRAEIEAFNAINCPAAWQAGTHYLDVTPISRQVLNDPDLIAADDLHPSPKMYAAWVQLLFPIAYAILTAQIPTPQFP